jgi:hypothetical protein
VQQRRRTLDGGPYNQESTVAKVVMGLGGCFILIAVTVLIVPDKVVAAADWESRGGQYLAGSMRIVFGLLFAVAAPSTRYPKGLRVFGIVLVVAGFLVMAVPNELWAGMIHWWLVENLPAYRFGGAIIGALLGAFLIQAGRPEPVTG